jgi:hypothetical protein
MVHGRWMMSHVWALIAYRRIMVASNREGHASSLEIAGDLIWLLLIIVEVAVLPYQLDPCCQDPSEWCEEGCSQPTWPG